MIKAVVVDSHYGSVSIENLELAREKLAPKGIELLFADCYSEDELIAACSEADVLMGTGNPLVTRKVLDGLPNLKIVSRFGVGVNSIDLDYAALRGVPVTFMPGFCANELTEHATALIMSLMRNATYYDRHIRAGKWPKGTYLVPQNLHNCTIGLMGFGAAARPMSAVFGKGFGSKVIACDPFVQQEAADAYAVTMVSFEELLEQSDIISIHAPLTPETKNLFGYEEFKKMKNSSMIINVSRGGIINETDLARALQEGEISYAGLDVFEKEPIEADHPLKKLENVVLTPHSAFYGEEGRANQVKMAVEILDGAFNENKISARVVANKAILKKPCRFDFI